MKEPAVKSAVLMFFSIIIAVATSLATNVINATGYSIPILIAIVAAAMLTPIAAWLMGYKLSLSPEIMLIFIVICAILVLTAIIGVSWTWGPFSELLP